jgi:hypothetical protein
MSKNPSEKKDVRKGAQHHDTHELQGQKERALSHQDKGKRTVNFDEGQKFTSDEDILRRRTA